jgi:predicted phage baseplate assembly protein
MALPTQDLDKLPAQSLVDDAKKMIQRYCPEWTDYNVSDSGIALLELFAWMLEKLSYQLNQVPEKNYVKFLELLNVQLRPPKPAKTDITFYLSAPLIEGEPVVIGEGIAVSTRPRNGKEPVIFTTDGEHAIGPVKYECVGFRHGDHYQGDFAKHLKDGDQPMQAFSKIPEFSDDPNQPADAFWIGFSSDVSGYVLRLAFDLKEVRGVGINPKKPPLVWECWCERDMRHGQWINAGVGNTGDEADTTDGLNRSGGKVVLHLPQKMIRTSPTHPGQNGTISETSLTNGLFVLRCRVRKEKEEEGEKPYSRSPEITGLTVAVMGIAIPSTHCDVMVKDELGRSSGEPGQTFKLRHWPAIELESEKDEAVEVESSRGGFERWKLVKSFDQSSPLDKHVMIDAATGEVRFGPAVRQQDGKLKHYGDSPDFDRLIRVSRYRYGGGSDGNVAPHELSVLRTSIPKIDRAVNRFKAEGGLDRQEIDDAARYARERLRAQDRMVTATDYETRARQFSHRDYPRIIRGKCFVPPLPSPPEDQGQQNYAPEDFGLKPGQVRLRVVPDAVRKVPPDAPTIDLNGLHLQPAYKQKVSEYLDEYRLLTSFLEVCEARYVQIAADVDAEWNAALETSEQVAMRIERVLNVLLSPLDVRGSHPESFMANLPEYAGFGDAINDVAIALVISQIPEVTRVKKVEFTWRALNWIDGEGRYEPTKDEAKGGMVILQPDELPVPGDHVVKLSPDQKSNLMS